MLIKPCEVGIPLTLKMILKHRKDKFVSITIDKSKWKIENLKPNLSDSNSTFLTKCLGSAHIDTACQGPVAASQSAFHSHTYGGKQWTQSKPKIPSESF